MDKNNQEGVAYTTLDVETTFLKHDDGSSDNRPYNSANKLVSVGLKPKGDECDYYMISHDELTIDKMTLKSHIQTTLDETELLIGHNIKFDLAWMRECGYKYSGKLWDTMLVEKILSGGRLHANELSLTDCCQRYGLPVKTDEVKLYWKKGIPTDEIPWPILREYGINDVEITELLYLKQLERVNGTV